MYGACEVPEKVEQMAKDCMEKAGLPDCKSIL